MNNERFSADGPDNKTRYFSSFALSHMKEMRILKEGGLLGKGSDNWRNISEHCLTEAVVADVLAEVLLANKEKLVQAALLHDWYKRCEVEAMQISGAGEGYKSTINEDKRILREHGISEEVIQIAHSNIPQSADQVYLDNRSLEQKIMHFIDAITSGSDLVNVNDRFDFLETKARNVAFSNSFIDKFKKPLYDLQRELTKKEQEEFERILGIENGTLIDFIESKIQERIDSVGR